MTSTLSEAVSASSSGGFAPTDEQLEIMNAARTGADVTVRALAGTGKTTTLVMLADMLAEERPEARIVYLAFNKSVQIEADGKFPSNVETRTADSVAWKHPASAPLTAKGFSGKQVTPEELVRALGVEDIKGRGGSGREWMVAGGAKVLRLARKTVDNFCITADTAISKKHLARLEKKDEKHAHRLNPAVLDLAQQIWLDILNPEGVVPVTNTHVTKHWALLHPDLSKEGSGLSMPADVIFFDEAQDVNEVLGDVVARQRIQKIIVGDGNQAIYGWRGAVDYLDKVDTEYDLPLTTSFRFGSDIAEAGNRFLRLLHSPWMVTGAGQEGLVEWSVPEGFTGSPDAVITRTNAGAIRAIMGEMAKGRQVKIQARYADDLKRLIATAEWLMTGGEWKSRPKRVHEDLVEFKNWTEVRDAVNSEDAHYAKVRTLYTLVSENGIPRLKSVIDATVTAENAAFDVAVMTAHGAKGLEWNHVLIYGDFWVPRFKVRGVDYLVSEEVRLAYVAVTRAKQQLSIQDEGITWALSNTQYALDSDLGAARAAGESMRLAKPTF